MALSETLTETAVCNMALSKLGSKKISNVETENSVEAIQCRLHYESTRDALLRSFYWPFAAARSTLTENASEPDFEWDNQFDLPDDFLSFRSIHDNDLINPSRRSAAIEGSLFLTNESTVEMRYTKKVTTVSEFDPLFIQVLILQLAINLISLPGANAKIKESIKDDLKRILPSVRALSRQEAELRGRADADTWVDVRATRGGRIDSRLGSG